MGNTAGGSLMTFTDREIERLLWRFQNTKRCGAKTRSGKPCRERPATLWNDRCRLHGGLSTGARTTEGRVRIAEAQRARWRRWRAEKGISRKSNDDDKKSMG